MVLLVFVVCDMTAKKKHEHEHSKKQPDYQYQYQYRSPLFRLWGNNPRSYPYRYGFQQYNNNFRNNYNNYDYYRYNNRYRQQPRGGGSCGMTFRVNQLIVHGEEIEEGTFPWMAAVFAIRSNGPTFICGGTLVSQKHIITAAHCVKSNNYTVNATRLLVVLGKCNLQNITEADTSAFKVAAVLPHSDYKLLSGDGDIAVLELQDTMILTDLIQPACLWSGSDDLENIVGLQGVVAGWGKTETGELSLVKPKIVKMPIVSQETCLRSHPQFATVTSDRTLCAGTDDGSGPCNGDSGGGLMINTGRQWVLRGLVSLSLSSGVPAVGCDLSLFVVFTDVSKYKDWLYSVIK